MDRLFYVRSPKVPRRPTDYAVAAYLPGAESGLVYGMAWKTAAGGYSCGHVHHCLAAVELGAGGRAIAVTS